MTSTTRWLTDREQAAWRAFLDMHARLNAQLNRELQADAGLSLADFAVMAHLSDHGCTMRVLELARSLGWEKSRLSHQLSRMQQRGLIQRADCASDRRGAFIELTDEGRRTIEAAAPPHVEAVRRYLFDHLTPEQVDALTAISTGVIARLDDACASSCPGADDPCSEADDL
ncbi:MAG: MarR family winged helix-turn-helix transcriptional regulator [Jatrophihabitans sp.]|uniref:MarR family winged helix-turn-helix transcriptional regulator n=1 Tax=Jatrophihabitans sp. TaxID=1932789 RepID=UPI003F7E2231